MKRLLAFCAVAALAFTVTACKTDESALRDSSSLLLSAKEINDIFVGNTVTSADGKTYYFDRSGVVIGKGAYGDKNKGNWNITPEGQVCFSNWNANFAPSACYKVFFDNVSQQRKLVDLNGDVQFTVLNILTGNPNNF
jgi:predicted small secreted protein